MSGHNDLPIFRRRRQARQGHRNGYLQQDWCRCRRKLSVQEAVSWTVENEVRYIDCRIDPPPNALESFDETSCAPIRRACAANGIRLGLNTLPAVNIAEVSPCFRDAADAKAQGVQLLLGKQLFPAEGVIDFTDMVSRVEAADFSGHYMSAYGSLDDMLSGRDFLVERFPN